MMDVRTFSLGDLGTNGYLVWEEGQSDCLVVDCGASPEALIRTIRQNRWNPVNLILTHGHFDHLAGVEDFRREFPQTQVWIHSLEGAFLTDPDQNLSGYWSKPVICGKADGFLEDGGTISLGKKQFKIIHTPGHSPGSVVFYQEEEGLLFAGDLIFKDSIGRSDFPHSDPGLLMESLKKVLRSIPGDTRIYPGHGPSTTLGREKKHNPYLVELQ